MALDGAQFAIVFHLVCDNQEYIRSLVMDSTHVSLCAFSRGALVGGACMRLQKSLQMAELSFLYVLYTMHAYHTMQTSRSEQTLETHVRLTVLFLSLSLRAVKTSMHGRRIGQSILSVAKEYLVSHGIRDILTYADMNATNFFTKQKFCSKIRRPVLEWKKNVKHYDSSVPMQCQLLPDPIEENESTYYSKFSMPLAKRRASSSSSSCSLSTASDSADENTTTTTQNTYKISFSLGQHEQTTWPCGLS